MPELISPGTFDPWVLKRDLPLMLGLTIALLFMRHGFGNQGRINRIEGALLFLCFCS